MVTIRPAEPSDVPLILELIRELADYEKEPHSVVATTEDLLRDGFGQTPKFYVLVAECNGHPSGFAFYFFTYSTWEGKPALYLEDLFVKPLFRKKKIGFLLMQRLAQLAVEQGCTRFVWQVLDWNKRAIDFYEKLGAKTLTEWQTVRLEGDALRAFASTSDS